jgi:opacity protein-like surface antigen
MRFRASALAACLALATMAGTAAAQDRSGTFEISPFAGGYFGGRLYGNYPVGTGTYTYLEPQDTLTYGIRLAYNVNRHFGFEFDWTSAHPDLRTPYFYGAPANNVTAGRLRQNVYEANTIFSFGKNRANGYFGLGAGVATLDVTDTATYVPSRSRFTANVSGGAKFWFVPKVGVRLDARYRVIDQNDGDHGSCSSHDNWCTNRWENWSHNTELTGGLIFAF